MCTLVRHTRSHSFGTGLPGRYVDAVVKPTSPKQVARLVRAARLCDVVLIPFGGGTSVTQALCVPSRERRIVASVDMRRMSKLVWLDVQSGLACFEAGVRVVCV